jgi:VanZ like family
VGAATGSTHKGDLRRWVVLSVPIDAALRDVPWFWPGIVASIVLAAALERPVSILLKVGHLLAFLAVLSLGAILVVTLTPSIDGGYWSSARYCGFDVRMPLSPLALLRPEQRSLNVVLFIPLGLFLAWCANRKSAPWLLAGGLLLPIFVEFLQFLLPVLGRSCEAEDVVDNATGFVYGAVAGLLV